MPQKRCLVLRHGKDSAGGAITKVGFLTRSPEVRFLQPLVGCILGILHGNWGCWFGKKPRARGIETMRGISENHVFVFVKF